MCEVNPTSKADVELTSACDDNQEDEIGGANIVRAPEEPDDLTPSDASTNKVNLYDDEKAQQRPSVEYKDLDEDEQPTTDSTDFGLSKNTTGRGGATSRCDGTRGAARSGVGGRGGKGRKVTDTFYSYPSHFNASLFSPTKLNLPSGPFGLSTNGPCDDGEGDSSRTPYKIPLSPESITQLSNNINAGLFYVNNALELLKQSQLELQHAKFALEKIGRLNDLTQGDLYPKELASPMEAEKRQSGDVFSSEMGVPSTSSDNPQQTNGQSTAKIDQVQLDPFQFMDIQSSPSPTNTFSPYFTVGRGGGGGGGGGGGAKCQRVGRGSGGGGDARRKRNGLEPDHLSSYNSQLSKEGLTKLIKRFDSSLDRKMAKDLNNNRCPAVVLHDVGPVLEKRGNGQSSHYTEAAKIEASFEREISRDSKMARSTFKNGLSSSSTSIKSSESTYTKLSECDVEDTKMEEEKQVRQKGNSPQRIVVDVEEIEQSKLPELVTSNPNNSSSTRRTQIPLSTKSARQVEDKLLPKKTNNTKNYNLTRWRQLRVEPEVMDRIHKRLEDSFRSASQSDKDSFYISVSNSQQSGNSGGGKSSKKDSPLRQLSKRQKVDPASSGSPLSTFSATTNSRTSVRYDYDSDNLSDEEIFGLPLNVDNCACGCISTEGEETLEMEK